ncbi:MAG: hypothetical protein ACRDJ4_02755 [Actinomycetota bacterium]
MAVRAADEAVRLAARPRDLAVERVPRAACLLRAIVSSFALSLTVCFTEPVSCSATGPMFFALRTTSWVAALPR